MASVMVPLLNTSHIKRPDIRPQQKPSEAPRNLLNLDCSSDLSRYSRDLGPGVQARNAAYRSDVLRAQFEDHREHILRHKQQFGSPVQTLAQIPTPAYTSASVPPIPFQASRPGVGPIQTRVHPSLINHSRRVQAQHPGHGSPFQSPHTIQHRTLPKQFPDKPLSSWPRYGKPETYPPGLREAIEKSSRILANAPPDPKGTIYHVVVSTDKRSTYTDDTHEVIGTYTTVRPAIEKAIEHFVEEFGGHFDSAANGESPKCDVTNDGLLRLEVDTDGPTGGLVTVHLKKARLGG